MLAKLALLLALPATLHAAKPAPACRAATFEGELRAGEPFARPLGNGLLLYAQPIASGWIVRVLPQSPADAQKLTGHDYAELATPPYQSVSPLSLSTDFAFRAQDAVGWNPRRFRFATSAAAFDRLQKAYLAFIHAGATPPAALQVDLSTEIAQAAEATLTILDARLTPGTADQWQQAAAVASHFLTTAHTLVPPPDGRSTPLGQLLWLKIRVQVDLPPGFRADPGLRTVPRFCSNN